MPVDSTGYSDYGTTIQKSHDNKAPFCKPKELKSDIDRAIQSLRPTEKIVVITLNISGYECQEVSFWLGKNWIEVQEMDRYIIRKMKRFLNGIEEVS
jgi:hypothetical protein